MVASCSCVQTFAGWPNGLATLLTITHKLSKNGKANASGNETARKSLRLFTTPFSQALTTKKYSHFMLQISDVFFLAYNLKPRSKKGVVPGLKEHLLAKPFGPSSHITWPRNIMGTYSQGSSSSMRQLWWHSTLSQGEHKQLVAVSCII